MSFSSQDSPTIPLATNVSVPANGANTWMCNCTGYQWAYIEIGCDRSFSFWAVGKSAASSAPYHYQVNDGGSIARSLSNSAGTNYSIRIRCTGLDQVGVTFSNLDGTNAATVNARVVLGHN